MSNPLESAPSPRLRPFRIGAYVLYFGMVGGFVVLVTLSVIRSVRAMSPGPLPAAAAEPAALCRGRAAELWGELEAQRRAFADLPEAREAGKRWTEFRTGWLARFREAESHCAQGDGASPALRALFSQLARVQLLYATHANQYAAEVGGAVDSFRKSLAAAE